MFTPDLSVILVTPDGYDTIRETIRSLHAQTVRDRLELVIIAPSKQELGAPPPELADLRSLQIVEIGPLISTGQARAAGIRAAHAPIVVLAEDHCFPLPDWAHALIEAHRGPWASVGPELIPLNPDSPVSRADELTSDSDLRLLAPARGGTARDLQGRNASYKRDLLLAYGPDLGDLLAMETVLHQDLRARGYQLYVEPAAKARHKYFVRFSQFIVEQWYIGRVLAGTRAGRWPIARRALYVAGAPLLPFVRFWRIRQALRSRGEPIPQADVLLPLCVGLIVASAGELVGYVCGFGDARHALSAMEFNH